MRCSRRLSGPTGTFTLALSPEVREAEVVIVAPNTPVVLDRIRFTTKETAMVVPDVAAVLRIVPHHRAGLPSIARNGMRPLPLATLFLPRNGFGPPREVSDGAIELQLAPGQYSVCYSREGGCVVTDAPAGAVTRIAPPESLRGTQPLPKDYAAHWERNKALAQEVDSTQKSRSHSRQRRH